MGPELIHWVRFVLGIGLIDMGFLALWLGVFMATGRRTLWPRVYLLATLMGGGRLPTGLVGRSVASLVTGTLAQNGWKALTVSAPGIGLCWLGAHICGI